MDASFELLMFAGAMALAQFSPGPDMILLTRTSLKSGVRAGVKMALGIACGLSVHATVAVAGLAVAFERSPELREGLRWAAVAYLLWLAFGLVRAFFSAGKPGEERSALTAGAAGGPFLRGFLCNLLNPKAVIFIAALSAPFLTGSRPEWWPLAIWGIVVVQAGVLWSLWARLLQWKPLRQRYQAAERWIDAGFGVVLAALAFRLLRG
jgi:threonine efflux protein